MIQIIRRSDEAAVEAQLLSNRTSLDWLRNAARAEAEHGSFSVGGLAVRLGVFQAEEPRPSVFSQFVEFGRRRMRLTPEELAAKADIDIEELVLIERGECETPSARTVHKLAQAFQLPTGAVAEVAGLVRVRNERLDHATYLFAARSEPTAMLSEDEDRAYQEFVKVIVESTETE
jgi:HTH-type transcriptional regulator, competence development regulator